MDSCLTGEQPPPCTLVAWAILEDLFLVRRRAETLTSPCLLQAGQGAVARVGADIPAVIPTDIGSGDTGPGPYGCLGNPLDLQYNAQRQYGGTKNTT